MKIKQLLVVPQNHHDIGYTHVPEPALQTQIDSVRRAIDLCEKPAPDPASAFCWTCEAAMPVLDFLKSATADEIRRFQALVHAKRISVTGGFMHMAQIIGTEEYLRFFGPVDTFRRAFGLPVSVVQHGDINGLSWGSVPLMREAGLDCLVMTLNPDHGRPPFEQPSAFYWEGPDGSRVLAWLSNSYAFGHLPCGLHKGTCKNAVEPIGAFVKRTEERDDYPFDFLVIHSGMDNRISDDLVCDAVREWNAKGHQPPMRIVTIDTAMELAREQARTANLGVYRGEWSDYWAHGHGSSAYEVGVARAVQGELRTAEAARALANVQDIVNPGHPATPEAGLSHWYGDDTFLSRGKWQSKIDDAYRQLLLFEEHTWGTNESVSRPHTPFTRSHWNRKAGFAYGAADRAHDLEREAFADLVSALPAAENLGLVVANPLGSPRDAWVTFLHPNPERRQEERPLFEDDTVTVLVRDIPPLGVKVVPLGEPPEKTVNPAPEGIVTLETPFYTVQVDSRKASITGLFDKALKKEWVDPSALTGIGGVVYEAPDKTDPHPALTKNGSFFNPEYPGPRFLRTAAAGAGPAVITRQAGVTTVALISSAPTMPRIRTAITFSETSRDIDVALIIDKQENLEMESIHALFPFALKNPEFLLETANATYRADTEQLPDTCRDWQSIQYGIGVTDGTYSVRWATREAPLVQLGGFHTGKWLRELKPETGHIASWLMNNIYFTNFKASQGGQLEFHFRFAPQVGAVTASELLPWAETHAFPAAARLARVEPGDYRWLNVSPSNALVQYLKPAHDEPDALVLRLRETSGQPVEATVVWESPQPVRMFRWNFLESTDPVELPGDGHRFTIPLGAWKLATIKIILKGQGK